VNNVEAHARFGLELAKRNAALVSSFRQQMTGLVRDVGDLCVPDADVLDACDALAVAQVLHAAMAGFGEEEANRIVELMGWLNTDNHASDTKEAKP
jgi:hypothetical protein